MGRISKARPISAVAVVLLALVAAVAGSAIAAPDANTAANQTRKALKTARKAKRKATKASRKAKAAQGTANAAQAAAKSVSSKLACPHGTAFLDGVCIETSPRAPTDWQTAANKCLEADRRLPSIAELVSAALKGIFSTGETFGQEFTNSLDKDDPFTYARTVVGGAQQVGEENYVDWVYTYPYRCVAPAGGSA
jgi:ADP-ribosylglycohydrolase